MNAEPESQDVSSQLHHIGQISIPVHDLARAVAFYRDVLCLRFLFQAPPGLAFFDCGGVRLMLAAPEGGNTGAVAPPSSSTLYYAVDNIEAARDALRARGASFVDEPHIIASLGDHDLWMVFLRDSEGNLVGLMEERAVGWVG